LFYSEEELGNTKLAQVTQTNEYIETLKVLNRQLHSLIDKVTNVFGIAREWTAQIVGVFSVRTEAACGLADRQLKEIEYLAESLHESDRERGVFQTEALSLSTQLQAVTIQCEELRTAEAAATTTLSRVQEQLQLYIAAESTKFTWSRVTDLINARLYSVRSGIEKKWVTIQTQMTAWYEVIKKRLTRL